MENKIRIAHSNFRKGLHDYNDGSFLNHNLGNDDYKDGANLPDEEDLSFLAGLDGRVALGNLNDVEEEDEEEEKA